MHFFTISSHRQTYYNYDQPCQTFQNSDFLFSVENLVRSFKKNSMENIGLGHQLVLILFFENFDFLSS